MIVVCYHDMKDIKKVLPADGSTFFMGFFVHHQVEVDAPLFDKITQFFVLFIFYQNAV